MQELYKEIESLENTASRNLIRIKDIKQMIGNYDIQKEKQQIIDAFKSGEVGIYIDGKNYYDEYYE